MMDSTGVYHNTNETLKPVRSLFGIPAAKLVLARSVAVYPTQVIRLYAGVFLFPAACALADLVGDIDRRSRSGLAPFHRIRITASPAARRGQRPAIAGRVPHWARFRPSRDSRSSQRSASAGRLTRICPRLRGGNSGIRRDRRTSAAALPPPQVALPNAGPRRKGRSGERAPILG